MQDSSKSIDAMELRQSCTKPLICLTWVDSPPTCPCPILQHLASLKAYFLRGVGDMDSLETPELADIMATLHLNSQESRDLILSYLQEITLEIVSDNPRHSDIFIGGNM